VSQSQGGGVTVTLTNDRLVEDAQAVLDRANADAVAARLVAKDPTTWGPDATHEASIRLGWLDCATVSRPLVGEIDALRAQLADRGVDRVVLAGMGGSSLAPEVITGTYGVPLVVLDTTDPAQISAALVDLDRTVLVVSSKSGGTIETDSHRRLFEKLFRDNGIDPTERIVVVTDPGSPLEQTAREAGYRVFLADPNVGGRYSALTAFGLVPSGLAGAPVGELLDQAAAVQPFLDADGRPALALGAALGGYAATGHDKLVIDDINSGINGFGDWAEQLIAESTGKQGRGLLPVVVEPLGGGELEQKLGDDSHYVVLSRTSHSRDTTVDGPLGAQFLVWEYATAVTGYALGIDPFDQPNVQESKDNTKAVLEKAGDGPLPEGDPAYVDGAIEVHGDRALLAGATTVGEALAALLAAVPDRGYLAVMAYLDRLGEAPAAGLRKSLAKQTPHAVTFGWGPRFLHSTGQYHKGGPQVGAFLQITGAHDTDLDVPGQPFTFGRLQLAQALGDLQALQSRDRPVLRLHLTNRKDGLAQLLTTPGTPGSPS
jgi:glucose-6-phosphate isomerase